MLKKLIPDFIYQSLASFYKKLNRKKFLYWEGDYNSWAEAQAKCKGYDEETILEKVKESALKVKNGEAVFERDGVLFFEEEYTPELREAIMKISSEYNGTISVLDFGGSLGSTYFQYRKILKQLKSVTWCVVEQDNYVNCGKAMFENDELKFEFIIEEAIAKYKPNLLLLGSVLQYLPEPYEWLQKFLQKKFPYVIIERSPFIDGSHDRLTIQHVPEKIYKSSYPSWFFSEQKFLNKILEDYDLILSYPLKDKANIRSEFKGFIFKLK